MTIDSDQDKKGLPIVMGALHLPRLLAGDPVSMSHLEDYTLKNVEQFVKGGLPSVILQDKTLTGSRAYPQTIAVMTALGRSIRTEFPSIDLGIIIEANDPIAPLAIALACGATYVRIKVFVGSMLKSTGLQKAIGLEAINYRNSIGCNHIKILADVYDRTGYPLLNIPITEASKWAVDIGADALILTGLTFDKSLEHLENVRNRGILEPLILGGSVTTENLHLAFKYADSVLVSSSLKSSNVKKGDILQWDLDKIKQFMEVVNKIEFTNTQ